jgi:methylated-DNA-[protein]-cysteine S-methyltransferase
VEDAVVIADRSAVPLPGTVIESPVGPLLVVVSAVGLRSVTWADRGDRAHDPGRGRDPTGVLDATVRQLDEYFRGTRTEFDVPLDPVGSDFQRAAWEALRTIPFGETVSYADQARRLGDVRKARAVGAANGRNPISVIVPCHRVVGADGSLTGFGGGIAAKAWLLDHERRVWAGGLGVTGAG